MEVDRPLGLAALLPHLVGAQRAPPFSPSQYRINSFSTIFLKSEGVYNVLVHTFANIISQTYFKMLVHEMTLKDCGLLVRLAAVFALPIPGLDRSFPLSFGCFLYYLASI